MSLEKLGPGQQMYVPKRLPSGQHWLYGKEVLLREGDSDIAHGIVVWSSGKARHITVWDEQLTRPLVFDTELWDIYVIDENGSRRGPWAHSFSGEDWSDPIVVHVALYGALPVAFRPYVQWYENDAYGTSGFEWRAPGHTGGGVLAQDAAFGLIVGAAFQYLASEGEAAPWPEGPKWVYGGIVFDTIAEALFKAVVLAGVAKA